MATEVTYLEEPTVDVARRRQEADACETCGTPGLACTCRYCRSCSRWWVGPTAVERFVDLDRPDGAERQICPECVALGFGP